MPDSERNEIDACGSVSQWLDGVKEGASEAQFALWHRYIEQVVRFADYRLKSLGVRSQEGGDIASRVFEGFFRRAQAGQFPNLNDRDDLWQWLLRITNDRVIEARRKRRIALTESALEGDTAESGMTAPIYRISDGELTPELGYALGERLTTLFARMDERHPSLN